ncbi:MAG: radical SAM protein, partial [bacterium]|nr:radical SAM protein [bacterium]
SAWGQHIYLPNGVLSMAARLMHAGVQVDLIDENVDNHLNIRRSRGLLEKADIIGIGVLGAPYIPEALYVAHKLRCMGHEQPIHIGGPAIGNLTPQELETIFRGVDGQVIYDPHGTKLVCPLLNVPDRFGVSMGPAIRALPEYMQEAYFTRPWCLFTSDGCHYNCRFCAAHKGVRERFRERRAFEDETHALIDMTERYAGKNPDYEIYLSSLDGCQNPMGMESLLRMLHVRTSSRDIKLKLRFLATAKSVVKAVKDDVRLLHRWRDYGITCIGLGVDGVDPLTWARENKRHNSHGTIDRAFALIRDAGIQEEALMVVGFPGDSARAMLASAATSLRMARRGKSVRPYLGKVIVPGTRGWQDNPDLAREFLRNPMLFRELDYAGVGSQHSHPDTRQRHIANLVYLATIFALKRTPAGCATNPLLRTASPGFARRLAAGAWNRRMPIDR